MKRFLLALFVTMSQLCNAQFVLTPSAGLMTEDGPFVIKREATEAENYYAAKKAVEQVVAGANVGDQEYEKSFLVTSAFKEHKRLPGALIASYWTVEYTLEIDCSDGQISISFKELGPLAVASKKGEVFGHVYPTTGRNSMIGNIMGAQYVFNSKGEVAKGCKKLKEIFEDFANNLAKDIENSLK